MTQGADDSANAGDDRRPAHRPSRRPELIAAAIATFAQNGYAESSIEDVAERASVVPTAIYYHFGTKEELLHQALAAAMDDFSKQIVDARDSGPTTPDALRHVIRTGWAWWGSHPDEATLIARYSSSAIAGAAELRAAWEEKHRARAVEYFGDDAPRPGRVTREVEAVTTIRTRALLDIILATEAAALPDGALADFSADELADEVADVCARVVSGSAYTVA